MAVTCQRPTRAGPSSTLPPESAQPLTKCGPLADTHTPGIGAPVAESASVISRLPTGSATSSTAVSSRPRP
ncbi:hypothetical protein AB0K14_37540 [Actinosynnema sp. NPDC050801]|uniref:hypothetical protein n=1 Tax=unclassified Actinosynnema TaxID=2637065 RepID=UPI0033C2A424